MNKTKKLIILTFVLIFMLTFIWKEKHDNDNKNHRTKVGLQQSRFTEEEKRQIFRDVIIAENRSATEAEIRYPSDPDTGKDNIENLEEKLQYMNKLTNKYKEKVFKNHNITEEEWENIAKEAVAEGWDIPTY